jgi:hypothetical protein
LHQRFEQNGNLVNAHLRYTDTWIVVEGKWRYVSGHASRLNDER